MGTEADSRRIQLQNELMKLADCGRALASAEQTIAWKRTSREPAPCEADFAAAAENEPPYPNETEAPGSWGNILWKLRQTLVLYWLAWHDAHAALQALPPEWVDDATKPPLDRWTARLRKRLNSVGDAMGSTRPCRERWGSFLLCRLPRDWQEQLADLDRFADELRAIAPTLSEKFLTNEDALILAYLLRHSPVLRTQYDIEAGIHVDRKTIGKRLEKLATEDLICRPEGDRKGVGLTPAGKSLAGRVDSSILPP